MSTVSSLSPISSGAAARPRRGWPWVLLFSALVPILAIMMASVRGAGYLEINTDPEYAYLLNALRIAEGHAPHLIEHPGTPAQCVGAGAMRIAYAFAGRAPLRDDVLLRPELYLNAYRLAMVIVTTCLCFVGGLAAWRGTGRLVYAFAIQAAPFMGWAAAIDLDRPMPEPLLIGLGVAFSGVLLAVLSRQREQRCGRLIALLGLFAGFAVATKMLFAPMALVPLVALPTWRRRFAYAGWAALFFIVALLPMASQFGRTIDWIRLLASHTGQYGHGSSGFIDRAAYVKAAKELAKLEPAYAALMVGGLFLGVIAVFFTWRVPERRSWARTLLGLGVAQALLFGIVAKHPAPHYLAAGSCVGGLSVCLVGAFIAGISSGRRRIIASFLTVAATIALCSAGATNFWRARDTLDVIAKSEVGTADAFKHAENPKTLQGMRISTPQSALHFGNFYAGGLYTPDLERLYPGILFWDWNGITAFGRPATDEEKAAVKTDGGLHALVSIWFNPHNTQPKDQEIATIRSLGRERFIEAREPAAPLKARDAFMGFEVVSGLAGIEGPYPEKAMPFLVRWGLAKETVLRFTSIGPVDIMIEGQCSNAQDLEMQVLVDGIVRTRHKFALPQSFVPIKVTVPTNPGDHELRLRYSTFEHAGQRDICVLFRKIQVKRAGG